MYSRYFDPVTRKTHNNNCIVIHLSPYITRPAPYFRLSIGCQKGLLPQSMGEVYTKPISPTGVKEIKTIILPYSHQERTELGKNIYHQWVLPLVHYLYLDVNAEVGNIWNTSTRWVLPQQHNEQWRKDHEKVSFWTCSVPWLSLHSSGP